MGIVSYRVLRDVDRENKKVRLQFLACYDALRKRLKYRLGSEDLANDVLHETWLRVERMDDAQSVYNPAAYLYRTALNVANDQYQNTPRLLLLGEIDELLQVEDELQDPARITAGRNELDELREALRLLPYRQREILIASRMDDRPHREIALRFHISTRMVEKELKAALEFCGRRLQRKVVQRFGPGAGKTS